MLAFESFGRQSAPADAAAWRQWGGPTRNFIVTSSSLADASETGVTILAQAKIFDTTSWTVPTLAGTTLYARDREKIVALDLSARAVSEAR